MGMTMPSSSMPADRCGRCGLSLCACRYIRSLRRDGENAWLRESALAEYRRPRPHRAGCPCPGCFSHRLRSWESGQVTASAVLITTSSTREDIPA